MKITVKNMVDRIFLLLANQDTMDETAERSTQMTEKYDYEYTTQRISLVLGEFKLKKLNGKLKRRSLWITARRQSCTTAVGLR